MKTKDDILNELILDTISETDKITYFGKDGAVRGLYSALSHVFVEIWNDVNQTKRQLQIQTATGTDLEQLAEKVGLTRGGATKGTVPLIFNGEADTVIPAGSVVTSIINGAKYQTLNEITLGQRNSSLTRPVYSNAIGDIVLAESLSTGYLQNVGVGEMITLDVPITGVTVTNLVPSTGAVDLESDEELRNRILQKVDILNQGTNAFYESIAKEVRPDVLRAITTYNPTNSGINVYLLKNSLGTYSSAELLQIATDIYPKQRAMHKVTCYNLNLASIEITGNIAIKQGYTLAPVISNIASALSDLINTAKYSFAGIISYYDVYKAVQGSAGVDYVLSDTLLLNSGVADIQLAGLELPKFTYLSINDNNKTIQQSYVIM